ncbi:unnamed protein product [Taenia asiatica]|uniref:GATA-type domain-containing protein n=1 Tax=Taenia asiatica TaxID=60517 RepID=A0A0R3W2Y2_TAEAS|nr:unnamed protein product [Taenia asiatica]
MECVNCGCIDSGAWTFDGVGNYLCGYCQYHRNRLIQHASIVPCPSNPSIPTTATRDCMVQPVKRSRRTLPCQRPMAMRKDSIQTRKRRCAKKLRSGRNRLQQQQHQRHEPSCTDILGKEQHYNYDCDASQFDSLWNNFPPKVLQPSQQAVLSPVLQPDFVYFSCPPVECTATSW